MFKIEDNVIHITRGDAGVIKASIDDDKGNKYVFQIGDTLRFKVFKKRRHDDVVLEKVIKITEEGLESIDIELSKDDTKIGSLINKPTEFWYELELNPNTSPQTVIGYDEDGPKQLFLYPEGGCK